MDSGAKPELARLAYFALIGFSCHEWFGLVEWSDEQRLSFMELLRVMYTSCPESQQKNPQNSPQA